MVYDAAIVGGGIAGLTAAAYLSNAGYKVIVLEKEKNIGGLVNSFQYKGFTFDGGIRAIENSGIVEPMLRQLGIHIDFVRNPVTIGIQDKIVKLHDEDSLKEYQALLVSQFPESEEDIQNIMNEVKRVMHYMKVLYGIDNPLFLDLKKDKEYLYRTILPWLFKYIFTIGKIKKFNAPIDEHLNQLTQNQGLISIIAQHFFKKTPAFFALSYFSLYLDYKYPMGSTGEITTQLEKYIHKHHGEIFTETQICGVNPHLHRITDAKGNQFNYKQLIWAADLKSLYAVTDIGSIPSSKIRQKIMKMESNVRDKTGGDSIFTLYMTVDLDKSYFEDKCSAHYFFTPLKEGLHHIDLNALRDHPDGKIGFTTDKQAIIDWLLRYYELTTYEISLPVMRNENLAPHGKTGLIISTLFEYSLAKHISEMGWYEEFKEISGQAIARMLDKTAFPGIESKIMDMFTSTPLTLERVTGNSDGAITGWAFTNSHMPVVNDLPKVAQSVLTPIPDVYQAGQWTYSPSGLPISILTGKLAADRVIKQLR
ncbi:MAG: NAD(P)/FAD-dependent oxidoreductase [Clostridia bacterium]